jgi:hypothetical protein
MRINSLGTAAAAALALALSACSNSNSAGTGLTTSSILDGKPSGAADGLKMKNDDLMARPVYVAWTAARAQRCGFYFDAGKLKASYLAYEQTQGATGQALANIDKAYDTTQRTIADRIKGDETYCDSKKSAEIKTELGRHLASDWRPNFPSQAQVAQGGGGLFDSGPTRPDNTPWDTKDFWRKATENSTGGRK